MLLWFTNVVRNQLFIKQLQLV